MALFTCHECIHLLLKIASPRDAHQKWHPNGCHFLHHPLFSPLHRLSTAFNSLLYTTLLRTIFIIEWLIIKTKTLSILVPLFRIRERAFNYDRCQVVDVWCLYWHFYKHVAKIFFFFHFDPSTSLIMYERHLPKLETEKLRYHRLHEQHLLSPWTSR